MNVIGDFVGSGSLKAIHRGLTFNLEQVVLTFEECIKITQTVEHVG